MQFVERVANRGFGQPVIVGRRLTVYNVVSYAACRDNIPDFLKEFDLTMEELKSAIFYCKKRQCETTHNVTDQYCDGCILRTIADGWHPPGLDFREEDGISYAKDGSAVFLGTLTELDDDEFGQIGWLLAEKAEARI